MRHAIRMVFVDRSTAAASAAAPSPPLKPVTLSNYIEREQLRRPVPLVSSTC
jgi:hypothetical protein